MTTTDHPLYGTGIIFISAKSQIAPVLRVLERPGGQPLENLLLFNIFNHQALVRVPDGHFVAAELPDAQLYVAVDEAQAEAYFPDSPADMRMRRDWIPFRDYAQTDQNNKLPSGLFKLPRFKGYRRTGLVKGTLVGAIWQRLAANEIDNDNVYLTELKIKEPPDNRAAFFEATAPRRSPRDDQAINELLASPCSVFMNDELLNSFAGLMAELYSQPHTTMVCTDDPPLIVHLTTDGDFVAGYEPLLLGFAQITGTPPAEQTVWYRVVAAPVVVK